MKNLKKTSLKMCQRCEYFYGQEGNLPICGYYKFSGKRKQSPIGYCGDEYEPRTWERRKTQIALEGSREVMV